MKKSSAKRSSRSKKPSLWSKITVLERRHKVAVSLLVIALFAGVAASLLLLTKAADTQTMYRISKGNYTYYTISAPEKDFLANYGWTLKSSRKYTNPTSSLPTNVYKLQNNTVTDSWYFTTDYNEYASLSTSGWKAYGVGFTSATSSAIPSGYCRDIWKKYKAPDAAPRYAYTADANEQTALTGSGWTAQGTGFQLDYECTGTVSTPVATTSSSTTTTTSAPSGETVSATPTTTSCSNSLYKKTDGSFWTCSFVEEFNGTSLDRGKWFVHKSENNGYRSGTYACFVDSPNNISVGNGTLKLTARKESTSIACPTLNAANTANYTSGTVSTYNKFSQTYGRFEVRAAVPGTNKKGLHSAIWMLPQNVTKYRTDANGYAWPSSGEIDIAEIYSTYPDRAIPFLHYVSDPAVTKIENLTNNYCIINDVTKFHTYALEWTPSNIKILYDGKVCLDTGWKGGSPLTGGQPFDHPFYMILSQLLGVPENGNGFDSATTPLPATTQVDYVRIWK